MLSDGSCVAAGVRPPLWADPLCAAVLGWSDKRSNEIVRENNVLWQRIGGERSWCSLNTAVFTVRFFKRYANGIGGGVTGNTVIRRRMKLVSRK